MFKHFGHLASFRLFAKTSLTVFQSFKDYLFINYSFNYFLIKLNLNLNINYHSHWGLGNQQNEG